MPHPYDHEEPPRWCFRLMLACVVLYAFGCWVQACGRQVETVPVSVSPAPEEAPEEWATDTADAGVDAIARPMPGAVFKGQKKPPCTPEQTTIQEACWVEVARAPREDHCGREFFEHDGRCYLPVREAERPPTSIEP